MEAKGKQKGAIKKVLLRIDGGLAECAGPGCLLVSAYKQTYIAYYCICVAFGKVSNTASLPASREGAVILRSTHSAGPGTFCWKAFVPQPFVS